MNAQILDLERRFHQLQDEKSRFESEAKGKEEALARRHEDFKEEIQRLHMLLDSSEGELKDKHSCLSRHKVLLEDKSVEISKQRRILADLDEEGIRIQRMKFSLQQELQAIRNDHRLAEQGANRRIEDGEVLKRAKALEEDRLHNLLVEADALRRRLADVQGTADLAERLCSQKDSEIVETVQAKKHIQDEAATVSIKNDRLQGDKESLLKRIQDIELQSRLATQKLADLADSLNAKDNEVRSLRSSAAYAESKEASIRQDLRKLQTENESLQILLDRYRKDASVQKRLRDEESLQKYRLEEEKQRLAREALAKDIQAQNARSQLLRFQGSHNQLLEERAMVSQELEAVKEHANLLESQNVNVLLHSRNS